MQAQLRIEKDSKIGLTPSLTLNDQENSYPDRGRKISIVAFTLATNIDKIFCLSSRLYRLNLN